MTRSAIPIDASSMPDVSRLVQEVAQTGTPRLLQVGGAAAVLSPARPRHHTAKATTQAEFEAGLTATFGAWKELIDPMEFKRQRRELQEHHGEPRML